MTSKLRYLITAAALTAAPTQAANPERGHLLYDNFCHHCHLSEIHYRVNSEIDSWEELTRMVAMWQGEMGLDWDGSDVQDVASWLDWVFYRLPDAPGPR